MIDPDDTARFMQIRGDAELVFDGAIEHLDGLTRKYTEHPRHHGYVYPGELAERETGVTCKIPARRITLDAMRA